MLCLPYPNARARFPWNLADPQPRRGGFLPDRPSSPGEILMHNLQLGDLLQANNWLSSLQQRLSSDPEGHWIGFVRPDYEQLVQEVGFIQQTLNRLSQDVPTLEPAAISAGHLAEILLNNAVIDSDGNVRFSVRDTSQLKAYIMQANGRLVDGFRSVLVLCISRSNASLYENNQPIFGVTFDAKFKRAQYDLEESAKCLALGRGTASVFHLLRVMEVGIRAVRTCLGVALPLEGNERNWGMVLRRIREAKNAKPKGWAEEDLFDEIYALLDAVKGRFRDPTMHIEEIYTEEESRRVYETVRNFMCRLADRMDERGQPLA